MKRSGFKRRASKRPASSGEFTASVSKAPDVSDKPRVVAGNTVISDRREARTKPLVVVSPKMRAAARGEKCTLQIVGHCDGNPETSVMAHLPSPLKGYKSTDLGSMAVSCNACHAVIDGRTKHNVSESDLQFYMRRATILTLALLQRKELILVK